MGEELEFNQEVIIPRIDLFHACSTIMSEMLQLTCETKLKDGTKIIRHAKHLSYYTVPAGCHLIRPNS